MRFGTIYFASAYDIKSAAAEHEVLTGVPREPIERNLHRLLGSGAAVQLRVPLVDGLNMTETFLDELCRFLTGPNRPCRVDLLPYHAMAGAKFKALGMVDSAVSPAAIPAPERLEYYRSTLAAYGVPVTVSHADPSE